MAIDRMAMSFEPPDIDNEHLFDEIIIFKNV